MKKPDKVRAKRKQAKAQRRARKKVSRNKDGSRTVWLSDDGLGVDRVDVLPDGSRRVHLNDEGAERMQRQLDAFREKFGREPGPDDPLFFDPDQDVPTPLDPATFGADFDHLLDLMLLHGIDPACVHAMRVTERIVTDETFDLLTEEEQDEWTRAVDDYRAHHPPPKA